VKGFATIIDFDSSGRELSRETFHNVEVNNFRVFLAFAIAPTKTAVPSGTVFSYNPGNFTVLDSTTTGSFYNSYTAERVSFLGIGVGNGELTDPPHPEDGRTLHISGTNFRGLQKAIYRPVNGTTGSSDPVDPANPNYNDIFMPVTSYSINVIPQGGAEVIFEFSLGNNDFVSTWYEAGLFISNDFNPSSALMVARLIFPNGKAKTSSQTRLFRWTIHI
jgi:hypothetical protein